MPRPLHVLRPGVWRDKTGKTLALSAGDCAAIVAAHQPRRAPIVVGHGPHNDSAPALGWAGSARQRADGSIEIDPLDLAPELTDANKRGSYRFLSCELRRPKVAGAWIIRRIAMLGAVPPSIHGLDEVRLYSDGSQDMLMFSSGDEEEVLLATMPIEAPPAAPGGGLVDALVDAFRRLASSAGTTHPARTTHHDPPTTTGATVTSTALSAEEISRRETALAEREAALAARDQAFRDREAALARRESAAAAAEQESFVDAQVQAGRLTPLQKPAMIMLLSSLASAEEPIEVQLAAAQGEQQGRTIAAADFLRDVISAGAVRVPPGELSAGPGVTGAPTTAAIAARARELRAADASLSLAAANHAAAVELSGGAS